MRQQLIKGLLVLSHPIVIYPPQIPQNVPDALMKYSNFYMLTIMILIKRSSVTLLYL